MVELKELIDAVTDIKKSLIELEEMCQDCEDLDQDAIDWVIKYKECAYEDTACIKNILLEAEEYKKHGGD